MLVLFDRNGESYDAYYYLKDPLWTVEALVDEDAAIVEAYAYEVYGKPTIKTGAGNDSTWFTADDTTATASAKGNPYMFTSRRWDHDIDLQHNRARWYDPTPGRWLSRDPVGYADRMNPYEYAGCNPARVLDPQGQTDYDAGDDWGQCAGYKQGDVLRGTGLGDIKVLSDNLWPFKKGSKLAKVQCMLKCLGFNLPKPRCGFYWGEWPSKRGDAWSIQSRQYPKNVVSFLRQGRWGGGQEPYWCESQLGLAKMLWHELKGRNQDLDFRPSDDILPDYDKKVETKWDHANGAGLKDSYCCVQDPNKGVTIDTELKHCCCKCDLKIGIK